MSYDVPPPGSTGPEPSGRPRSVGGTRSRRGRALVPTLVILAALVLLFVFFAGFWTDLLWYQSVDAGSVFRTQIVARIGLFVIVTLVMSAALLSTMWIAHRFRPSFRGSSPEQQSLDRYRVALDPFRRWVAISISAGIGLLTGASAAVEWQTVLLFFNRQSFGTNDAQFGIDIGFFVFTLPFLEWLVGLGFAVIILALMVATVTHYLYGGLRLQTPGDKTTPATRAHLSVLIGLFVLLKAAAYWLDRYDLVTRDGSLVTGAQYTDVNAQLPAKNILVAIAVICAGLFFANAVRRTWSLPFLGLGLLVVSAGLLSVVYPAVVQQFQVRPSEQDREKDYIGRNISATRLAYGLADAQVNEYKAADTPTAGALAADQGTVSSIRLIDPAIVGPTFKQLQQIRGFYTFADTLDVDRYTINGVKRDAVVAVREVDPLQVPSRNWINDHLVYTHGFGFVGAYGNTATAETGLPVFFESNVPSTGNLSITQPRIYFGENSPMYSIVGGAGSQVQELDYPDDKSPNGQANYTYTGTGGVPVGSLLNRALFALRFQEQNILLSDQINAGSRILYIRDPSERVTKVAPWLTLDSDPYPAVVNGKVTWIIDGYTTTDSIPYSQRTTLGDATADSLTARTNTVGAQPRDTVNYIRNSVKATVDAYDGTVTLYEWDQADPILKAWEGVFPGIVKPRSDMSAELLSHVRYPEDLFKVQRDVLSKYHVTDPLAFYSGQDFWRIPSDPTQATANQPIPAYYLTLRMPDQKSPTFSLTTTFSPQRRDSLLSAFMAVSSDPGNDYGKIRVLQLPRSAAIPGPAQVQNQFKTDQGVSGELNLLRIGNTEVDFGNLLALPIGGGFLYVEPVYVRSSGGTNTYPTLKKILVGFGNKVAFEDTLQKALDKVFAGNAGTVVPPPPGGGTGTGTGSASPSPSPTKSSTAAQALDAALAEATAALARADAALKAGDFTAYGQAQADLAAAVRRADAARAAETGVTPSPTPSPSPGSSSTGSPTPAT